jgi:flagellar biogenesis protein FliO
MHKIILGGAPDANWFPLLLLLVAVLSIVLICQYVFKWIIRKKYNQVSENSKSDE